VGVTASFSDYSASRFLLICGALSSAQVSMAAATEIPFKQDGIELAEAVPDILWAMGIVCLLGFVAILWLRKWLLARGDLPAVNGTYITVLDRKTLSTRTVAHLLLVDGRQLLVCESNEGIAICELGVQSAEILVSP